jgi:hypothetical protein
VLPPATRASAGDILVVASRGLERLRPSPEAPLEHLARLAAGQPLSSGFARLVADWKRGGVSPGDRDVLLLAARRA